MWELDTSLFVRLLTWLKVNYQLLIHLSIIKFEEENSVKKFNKSVILLISFLLIIMVLVEGCAQNVDKKADTITLTDLAGREVEVSVPAERIVLVSSRYIHEFAALMGKDFSKKKAYRKGTEGPRAYIRLHG